MNDSILNKKSYDLNITFQRTYKFIEKTIFQKEKKNLLYVPNYLTV